MAAYLFCSALPLVLLAPWAGRLADTRDSRTLATASSVVSAAAVAGMGLGMQYLDNYLPALFAMTFLLDTAQAVAGPTWQALLPRIVGEERTPRALGTMQATIMIAGMVGPAAGGLLSGWGGSGPCLPWPASATWRWVWPPCSSGRVVELPPSGSARTFPPCWTAYA